MPWETRHRKQPEPPPVVHAFPVPGGEVMIQLSPDKREWWLHASLSTGRFEALSDEPPRELALQFAERAYRDALAAVQAELAESGQVTFPPAVDLGDAVEAAIREDIAFPPKAPSSDPIGNDYGIHGGP